MSAQTHLNILRGISPFSAAGIPKVRSYEQLMVAGLLLHTI